jgi:DNA-binding response OmpR family regulator
MKRAIYVDDMKEVGKVVVRMMHLKGLDTTHIPTYDEAEAIIGNGQLSGLALFATDVSLDNGRAGYDLVRQIRNRGSNVPCLMISGADLEEARKRTSDLRGVYYVQKPFEVSTFFGIIDQALASVETPSSA